MPIWPRRCHPLSLLLQLALHVDTGDSNTTALEREKSITLQLMRDHITEHGEDAWRSVAGAGYSMPQNMAGRPREL